jgi:DNA-binding transcriptional ArsR family regulator
MTKREAQEITMAMVAIQDARRAVAIGADAEALAALEDAAARLHSVPHTRGIPVAQAARRLEVSQPTVRAWLDRGVLVAVTDARPDEVEIESLRLVMDALADLRARGRDRDWVEHLATYLRSAEPRSDALKEGLEQLRRGELEPA